MITVCADTDRNCPVFSGKIKHRLHIGFDEFDLYHGLSLVISSALTVIAYFIMLYLLKKSGIQR